MDFTIILKQSLLERPILSQTEKCNILFLAMKIPWFFSYKWTNFFIFIIILSKKTHVFIFVSYISNQYTPNPKDTCHPEISRTNIFQIQTLPITAISQPLISHLWHWSPRTCPTRTHASPYILPTLGISQPDIYHAKQIPDFETSNRWIISTRKIPSQYGFGMVLFTRIWLLFWTSHFQCMVCFSEVVKIKFRKNDQRLILRSEASNIELSANADPKMDVQLWHLSWHMITLCDNDQ